MINSAPQNFICPNIFRNQIDRNVENHVFFRWFSTFTLSKILQLYNFIVEYRLPTVLGNFRIVFKSHYTTKSNIFACRLAALFF